MLVSFLILILILILMLVFASLQKSQNSNISKSFYEKFQTMFVESSDDGHWSSNRFAYVFTMLISNLILWGCILFIVITTTSFPEIPGGIIMVYGISNGVSSIAKIWQKREERFMEQLSGEKDKSKEDE